MGGIPTESYQPRRLGVQGKTPPVFNRSPSRKTVLMCKAAGYSSTPAHRICTLTAIQREELCYAIVSGSIVVPSKVRSKSKWTTWSSWTFTPSQKHPRNSVLMLGDVMNQTVAHVRVFKLNDKKELVLVFAETRWGRRVCRSRRPVCENNESIWVWSLQKI